MSTSHVLQTLVALVLGLSFAQADLPDWMKDGTKLEGKRLRTTCSGVGPGEDISIARAEAINSCRQTAIKMLQTSFKAQSLVIESEKELAVHSQIEESQNYSGVDCKPLREQVEQEEGSVKVYLACEFDLTKAKATPVAAEPAEPSEPSKGIIANRDELQKPKASVGETKTGQYIVGQGRTITIATIPAQCTDILIKGKHPRTVKCEGNPVSFVVGPADAECLVRSHGYVPKTIKLTKGGDDDSITIHLDPAR